MTISDLFFSPAFLKFISFHRVPKKRQPSRLAVIVLRSSKSSLLLELSCVPDRNEIRYLAALSTFNDTIYYAVDGGLLQDFSAII